MQSSVRCLYFCPPFGTAALLCVLFALPFYAIGQGDTSKRLKEVKVNTKPLPQVQTLTPSQQISAADFDQYNALNVADAIRNFAGVNIKDYGGIGGLKTVSVRGFGANHTAVLYDGIEISDAENGQIDLGKLNLSGVAKITLYNAQPDDILAPARSFASASVLSIKTVQPILTAAKPYQLLFGVKGGSFGLINPYLQWQQRINSNWSFMVNTYLDDANGRFKYKTTGDGSDTSQTRINAALRDQQVDGAVYWTKNDSNKFNLHINYYNSDRGLPGAVVYYDPTSNQRLWNQNFFAQSGYEHTWDNGLQVLLNGKFSHEYTRYADPDYLNGQGGLDDKYELHELYFSSALAYRITSNWQIVYASDIAESSLGGSGADGTLYKFAYPSRFTLLNSVAGKFTFGKWQLQGDLLNTYVNESVETGTATPARNVLSPTLMASVKPFKDPDLLLRAFYKDIFREPTFNDQYFFATNGSRGLKPEFARQYDLGLAYRKGFNGVFSYVTLTIDAYYNSITNKIVAVPNQNLELASITNLGKVSVEGADISLKTQTKMENGWHGTLALNYTYQYAVDVDANSPYYLQQIAYTPKNALAANVGVDHEQLGLYFNQILASSRYYLGQSDPQNYLNGYAVSDLSLVYKFSIENYPLTFAAHAANIFDTNYVIVRSFPMPGRSYLLSLQIKI